MSTQIYIQPPVTAAGCQPEYTKIASQSFIFEPNGLPGPALINQVLFTGGNVSIMDYVYPIWSADVRNYGVIYAGGNITQNIDASIAAMGISLPINLVPNDTVTISGNASFNNTTTYIEFGYDVSLILGVYYFNCNELTSEGARVFTFIPVSTTKFDLDSKACFSAEVTLGSNFDFHDTRILVGYNIIATCPSGECGIPSVGADVATVSYTLDIERPCAATIDNFIIRNCCETSITELVNIPGLVVGDFHVDNEGNCWEVMEASTNVTNFTRTFTDNYTSCLACQDVNFCPANLVISSCCVEGKEFVSGSLPGLNVGDTFVDNYGLCWNVDSETSAPLSEESITIDHIIPTGNCITCLEESPCPNFFDVTSCCARIKGTIAIPAIISISKGDAFVDTNGICWGIDDIVVQLPTIYGIEVATIYTGAVEPDTNCGLCVTANPCPEEYFITIRSCCDKQRVEVASVPADSMIFTEGLIFQDFWGICWEVMSFSTTGVETYAIWPWDLVEKPTFNTFKNCEQCAKSGKVERCITMYELKQCGTDVTKVFYVAGDLTIGAFYQLHSDGNPSICYEVIGYGYPVFGTGYIYLYEGDGVLYTNCDDCIFNSDSILKNVVWEYCDTPGVTYIAETTYSGAYSYGLQTTTPDGTRNACIHFLSVTTDFANSTFDSGSLSYDDCPTCLNYY
jgi:hypothetical protein